MCDLIVTDVAVLWPDMTVRKHQTVEVKDGIIADIYDFSEAEKDRIKASGAQISGAGKLLMPGLADCHMHTGQQLLKGRILDELPMIWTRIMLPFESTLTEKKWN